MTNAAIRSFEGSCHCGAIAFTFETSRAPSEWPIRACQCSFCRRHAARTTSDPQGRVSFRIGDDAVLRRYRFGLGTATFFVCRNCGVYLAAVLTSRRGTFATLNVNTLQQRFELSSAMAVSYDDESAEERQQRRERSWTPVFGAA